MPFEEWIGNVVWKITNVAPVVDLAVVSDSIIAVSIRVLVNHAPTLLDGDNPRGRTPVVTVIETGDGLVAVATMNVIGTRHRGKSTWREW